MAEIYELAGTGGIVREQWDGLDLDRQHAIRKSPLDHAVLAPGTPVCAASTSTASNPIGASSLSALRMPPGGC
jgi:hypothetical protein